MASMPGMDASKVRLVQELEIEMMSDMYNRLLNSCHRKCLPARYHEPDLGKGEAVCLDRCVAKFMDVYEKIGKKLTSLSQQEDAAAAGQLPAPQELPK